MNHRSKINNAPPGLTLWINNHTPCWYDQRQMFYKLYIFSKFLCPSSSACTDEKVLQDMHRLKSVRRSEDRRGVKGLQTTVT